MTHAFQSMKQTGIPSGRSAFTLVVVLGFLVLITALVIAFLSTMSTEYTSAKSYASGAATKQLADSAVQIALGQIRLATSGSDTAWASQPGMIRTYDSSGKNLTNYKLFSSDAMEAAGSYDPSSDLEPSWDAEKALYTDLNSPVADAGGMDHFPIIDPRAFQGTAADPMNLAGTSGVQGFYYSGTAPGTAGKIIAGVVATGSNRRLPMPVKWIYQLRDGTLTTPTGGTGNTATWVGADAAKTPSKNNPIVGRIALWTDDETCKVNINTAGEGTYWDTPHWGNKDITASAACLDGGYAWNQPVQGEFQRYPGHPAQVALSPIFPNLRAITAPEKLAESMAGITPRLAPGGSRGGTGRSVSAIDLSASRRQPLYASVDEFMFGPALSGSSRVLTADADSVPVMTRPDLENSKFFITANSRAPEVNLFNKPRISIWPVHSSLAGGSKLFTKPDPRSPYTTAFDRLSAFCATIGDGPGRKPYYFQREDAMSVTNDYENIQRNKDLYAYLQDLTGKPVPGFGGDFLSKYGDDRDQILAEIFDYIRCTNLYDPNLIVSGSSNVPVGSGKKSLYQFASCVMHAYPYAPEIGQVAPIHIPATTGTGTIMGFGRYMTVSEVGMLFVATAEPPRGAPKDGTKIYKTPADGEDYWRAQSCVVSGTDINFSGYINPTLAGTPLPENSRRCQLGILLGLFNPAVNPSKLGGDLLVRVSNLQSIGIGNATDVDGGALFPDNSVVLRVFPPALSNEDGTARPEGRLSYRWSTAWHAAPYYDNNWSNHSNYLTDSQRIKYPLISKAFTVPMGSSGPAEVLDFSKASLKIELFVSRGVDDSADPQPDNLVQTLNVTFPAGTFPQPSLQTASILGDLYNPKISWGFGGRLYIADSSSKLMLPPPGSSGVVHDVFRSAFLQNGDARMIAACPDVPDTLFNTVAKPDPDYSSESNRVANHYMPLLYGNVNTQPQPGRSVAKGQLTAVGNSKASVPSGTENYCTNGDFDISAGEAPRNGGYGWYGLGPYINKPDEGDEGEHSQDNGYGAAPYWNYYISSNSAPALYTPNKIMPSSGMFGSLSSRLQENLATSGTNGSWQTLLFRPQPGHANAAVPATMAGNNLYTTPPDHLLMDLFWMPVVEPYAISEPLSTAGKINLNYEIVPFTYVTRNTALVALLKNEKMAAVPNSSTQTNEGGAESRNYRTDINPADASVATAGYGGTLRQFRERFLAGDIFRSPTEICDIFLVPKARSWATDEEAKAFWADNVVTADNVRERPYTNLYARLTTKSNTYTVHFRVQSLQKASGTAADTWVEARDQIASEYRGSSIVERYIDTSDPGLPDFATQPNETVNAYYKLRILSTKRFAP